MCYLCGHLASVWLPWQTGQRCILILSIRAALSLVSLRGFTAGDELLFLLMGASQVGGQAASSCPHLRSAPIRLFLEFYWLRTGFNSCLYIELLKCLTDWLRSVSL